MPTDCWGIDDGYEDVTGTWRAISPRTHEAILSAMGRPDPTEAPQAGPVVLPEIRAASRCHLPPDLRTWGWAVQLYAARSRESWGMGDLADLRRLARWSSGLGAGVLLLNPLYASVPRIPEDPSPYSPSSRLYLNPLYLRIEEVPGAQELGAEVAKLGAAGRALNHERVVDRDAVARLKRQALDALWQRFRGDPAFDRYCAEEGEPLRSFAIFSTLAERHPGPWTEWPADSRHPESPAVERFAAAQATRVRFHQWMQWLLDQQLARAAREMPLVLDFPIGVDPDGADAWRWQDVIATGARIGAPPDPYNARGQEWGLPPFVPHRLRARAYAPFVQAIRATLRHAGGLRIDHVMGLFRLFWVPRGLAPTDGGYVRYPADELLELVALESQRAGAFVVGEDLGTVERGVRERLAARLVLSSRVMWFERDHPERYPELAMASVTTHDLPTIAGVWSGADGREQAKLGLAVNIEGHAAIQRRLATLAGVPEGGAVARVIEGAYRALAAAPSRVLIATLDDALAAEERPNIPGTTTIERPNWSIPLPLPLEGLEAAALPRAIAGALAQRGGASGPGAASVQEPRGGRSRDARDSTA
jgi:4-alpha-glucanotransferase